MKKIRTIDAHKHPNVKIAVRNFGPIAEGTVDLRPLTVFVGPSNTGKTYFATLLYTLHRSFVGFPPIPFPQIEVFYPWQSRVRRGALLDSNHFLRGNSRDEQLYAVFEKLKTAENPLKFSHLPQELRAEIESNFNIPRRFREEFETCFDLESVSQMRHSVKGRRHDTAIKVEVSEEDLLHWNFNMQIAESDVTVHGAINGDAPLRSEYAPGLDKTPHFESRSYRHDSPIRRNPLGSPIIDSGEPFYLPANRSGILQGQAVIASSLVARSTRAGFERLPEVPTFSTGVADFLQNLILYSPHKEPTNDMVAIAEALENDVLAGEVIMKPSPSGYPQFLYRPREMAEEIRLSNASSMVSELAPLVLFIRGIISPGDTLIIEEPESHLHPGAQPEVAVALARLVKAGVRVVVTTHSGGFLEEIGNLIREGELDEKLGKPYGESPVTLKKEDVGVWRFQPDGIVTEIEYNRVDGVDPEEYIDVASDLYNRSARLQNWLVQTEDNQSHE